MSDLLGVLAHADRLRIVEELADGERNVSTLQSKVGASRTSISQHLGLLRARHLVVATRRGQHVYYRLAAPGLSEWLRDGVSFVALASAATRKVGSALRRIRGARAAGGDAADELIRPRGG